jgi:hypothetical protein
MISLATHAKPLIVGLTAPAGTGKSSAATLLEEHYAFCPIGLADPILDMLCALAEHVDVPSDWAIERALKEQPMPVLGRSYRELAQTLGDEWGRAHFGADFWVRIADHKLEQVLTQGDNVVITDIRRPNEAAWLRRRGGVLVRIERDGHIAPVRTHASEAEYAALQPEHTVRVGLTNAHTLYQLDTIVSQLRASS